LDSEEADINEERGLIKSTPQEKVLSIWQERERERLDQEKDKALASKALQALEQEKERIERPKIFSELFLKLVSRHSPITAKDMEKFSQEEFHYLDSLVSKKVNFWHWLSRASCAFWDISFAPAFKLAQKSENLGFLVLTATVVMNMAGWPLLLGALSGSVLAGVITFAALAGSAVLKEEHYGVGFGRRRAFIKCDECHYLALRSMLKKERGADYLPAVEVVKLLDKK